MPDPARHTQLNKGFRLHLAAILYFLSRMAVVGFVFAVPALYFLRGQVEVPLVVGGAVFVAALFTGYYVAAAGLRCAACSGPVLLDNGNRKHPHAQRFPGLNHRARVAWDILFGASYQCMYCNTRCRCKKHWGSDAGQKGKASGRQFQPAPRHASASAETFPQAIFGDLTPLDETAPHDFIPDESEVNQDTPGTVPERVVKPSFAPAAVFPDVRTVPVTITPPTPVTGPVESSAAVAEPQSIEVFEAPPATVSKPHPLPPSPVPWTVPAPSFTTETASIMNRPTSEPQSQQGSNPFLAAAAAMPQPPGPALPHIPPAPNRSQADFRGVPEAPAFMTPEFPQPVAAPGESPAPWTLPSMPAAAATARVPGIVQPPSIPAAPTPVPVTPATAQVTAPIQATVPIPPDLLKDVVTVLEDGRRALTDAFQGLIDRLEAKLSSLPAAAPVVPVVQTAPAPVLPQIPPAIQPAVAPATPLEYAVQQPPPAVMMPPREKTSLLPLPPAASPPIMEPESATAPRRKFARPSGLAAQQLHTALQDVFEAPVPAAPAAPIPPAPAAPAYANGHGHPYAAPPQPVYAAQPAPQAYPGVPAAPPASPFEMITPGQFTQPAAPARQQSIPAAPAPASPFAVSPTPLMSSAEPHAPPAPFTFLKNEGDHFAPAAPVQAPQGLYDPLDDTPLPWMQPVGGRN